MFQELARSFPDLNIQVEELIAEGDKVVARVVFQGTHPADFQGMPATSKRIEMQVIDILRIEDGKIVERRGLGDQMGLMQQLGVAPV